MGVMRIGVSTFAALISVGLLLFLYLFPNGGLVRGLLELDSTASAMRDVSITTALAAINVALAVLLAASRGGRYARIGGAILMLLALVDFGLGFDVGGERQAWIPWVDAMSLVHGVLAITKNPAPRTT